MWAAQLLRSSFGARQPLDKVPDVNVLIRQLPPAALGKAGTSHIEDSSRKSFTNELDFDARRWARTQDMGYPGSIDEHLRGK